MAALDRNKVLKFVFNFFTQTGDEGIEVVTGRKCVGAGTSLRVKGLTQWQKPAPSRLSPLVFSAALLNAFTGADVCV
ncbi:hypothetical protein [Lacticaseibacillus casei]|uniref:hypothetical protein n=1 Tax=Lacticaseibacillus casei TaxID=1582 RepID=UPI0012E06AFA|nr:hypothetical protein [Lacticaseibacillus casei]